MVRRSIDVRYVHACLKSACGVQSHMPKVQQTFVNRAEHPVFIYVEVVPDCYKLQPGDRLTIVDDAPEGAALSEISFLSREELHVWPVDCAHEVLVNGKSAEGLSWNFDPEAGPVGNKKAVRLLSQQ